MKKFMLLILALLIAGLAFADTVQIGTGTTNSSYFPIYGLYGYNYSQQIYTQAEINTTGTISKIRFYYVSGTITNNKDWVIYMGHTTKTVFNSTTDWEPLANLTQVFAGNVTSMVPLANNWMEITLTTPFVYNNTSNLIIAVDENTAGYASMSWGAFASGANRGISYYSDGTNPDPATPPTANYGPNATINRIQLVFPNSAAPLAPALTSPLNGGYAMTGDKLYWTPSATGSDATSYDVYLDTVDGSTLVSDNQSGTNYTPTLAAGTTYYWKVVAANSFGDGPATSVWSFTTPGATQLTESFEGTSFPPAGWANPGSWSRSTSTYNHGVASAYKYPYDSALYIISTPKVTINATSTLSFMSYCSTTSASAVWDVVYSPDRTSWTQVPGSSFTHPTASTWVQRSIDLSSLAGNNYYLGIRAGGYSYASYYFDKVIGPAITPEAPGTPALSAPADLATNVNEYTNFTWTAPVTGGVPTGYKLYVDTVNPPVAQVADLNALTYTLTTPLAYNTTYYWSVAAYNGAGTGVPAVVRSFTTRMDPTIFTLPYTDGFEVGNTDAQPVASWSSVYVTGTKNWTANSTSTDYNRTPRTGTYNAYLGWSASTWMIRPVQLTGGTSYDVEVFARQDNADTALANMTIAYGTAGTAAAMTNVIVPQTGLTNGDYQRLIGSFIPASTGIYYIGILGTLPTSTNWYVSIDDITIRETPEGAPEAVTLNGPTDEAPSVSVMPTFTWTASLNGATPTGYDLYLDTTDGSTLFAHDVSSPYTLVNALPYSTEHFWTVVAYNGEGDGPAAAVRSFTTMDDPTVSTFPWTEGFDSVTAPALPAGWTSIDNNADGDFWKTWTGYSLSGTNAAGLYTDYNATNDDYLVTPPIVLSGNQRLKFWTRARSTSEPEEISILLSTSTPTAGAFTNVLMPTTAVNFTTYAEYTVDLSAYSGTCYISFTRTDEPADGWYLYVDNVLVEDIPVNPVFSLTPNVEEWNFGFSNIGVPVTKTFTVTNTGPGQLELDTPIVTGTGFALDSTSPDPLVPLGTDESATIVVSFTPDAVGSFTGTLSFNSPELRIEYASVDLLGACAAPNPVATMVPADLATDVQINPTFSWTAGAAPLPTGYKLYLGTDNPPTNLVNGTDLGLVTSYNHTSLLAASTLHYWKVVPYNLNGDAVGSITQSFTTGTAVVYAASGATSTSDDDIGQIVVGSFANPETAPTPLTANTTSDQLYNDYTALGPIEIQRGVATPFSLTQINSGSYYTCHFKVFMDLNLNGAFDLPGELLLTGSTSPTYGGSNPYNGTITVPLEASNVTTRMRVVLRETIDPALVLPTGTYSWGETEDYTVTLTDPPAGPPEAVTITSPANETTGLPIDGFDITWTPALTGGVPTNYAVFMSQDETTIYDDLYFETSNTHFNPVTEGMVSFDYLDRWYFTIQAINLDGSALVEPAFWFEIEDAPQVITTFPWNENFDLALTPPADWTVSDVDGAGTNWVGSATYSHSAPNSFKHGYSSAVPDPGQNGWLITPAIQVPAGNYYLSWWNYNVFPTWMVYNGVKVNTTNNPADPNWVEIWSNAAPASAWSQAVVNISAYAGQTVYFAFNYQGDNADDWYIDDVSVYELLVDTFGPTITHLPVINSPREDIVHYVVADIADDATWNNPIGGANMYYSIDGGTTWSVPIAMTLDVAPTYYAAIPPQALGTTVTYKIEAWDSLNNMTTSSNYAFTIADPTWIWYDQGGTTYLGYTTTDFGPTVLFENPFYGTGNAMQLLAVDGSSYYGNAANLQIWTYDGVNDLVPYFATPIPVTFGAQTYETFDLSTYNVQINTPYFFVSYLDVPMGNYILFDSTYDYGTSYVFEGTTLYTMGNSGSWVIGANVTTGMNLALDTPVVTIELNASNEPVLSWDAITGANSYEVYGAADPYAADPWTLLGTVAMSPYTYEGTDAMQFFKVVANSEAPTMRGTATSLPTRSIGNAVKAPKVIINNIRN